MSSRESGGEASRDLDVGERVCAAGSAALLSSLLVNPLDVIKTRMQAEAASQALTQARCPSNVVRNAALAGCGQRGIAATLPMPRYMVDQTWRQPVTRSASQLLMQMARREGVRSLWRGLDAALLLNLPLIAIYLPCYDYLESRCAAAGLELYGPLLSGMMARGIAVTATSPLELLKTRVQAAQSSGRGGPGRLNAAAQALFREAHSAARPFGACRVLWRGLSVSLAKDLPFAGLYWAVLEPTRSALLATCQPRGAEPSKVQIAAANALAGGLAASAAAALSTPLDVVKTKVQMGPQHHLQRPSPGLAEMLVGVARGGGVSALFTGVALRSVRTGAAYAILMASYEIAKTDLRDIFHPLPLPVPRSLPDATSVGFHRRSCTCEDGFGEWL